MENLRCSIKINKLMMNFLMQNKYTKTNYLNISNMKIVNSQKMSNTQLWENMNYTLNIVCIRLDS